MIMFHLNLPGCTYFSLKITNIPYYASCYPYLASEYSVNFGYIQATTCMKTTRKLFRAKLLESSRVALQHKWAPHTIANHDSQKIWPWKKPKDSSTHDFSLTTEENPSHSHSPSQVVQEFGPFKKTPFLGKTGGFREASKRKFMGIINIE